MYKEEKVNPFTIPTFCLIFGGVFFKKIFVKNILFTIPTFLMVFGGDFSKKIFKKIFFSLYGENQVALMGVF